MHEAVYGLCCWVGLVLILSGCNIPKDPAGTLEKVQGGTLLGARMEGTTKPAKEQTGAFMTS